jgi:hypothetical protein
MSLDREIDMIGSIYEAIEDTIDQFVKSSLNATSGKDIFSQVLSSITTTIDVIMLGFMGASVVGVLVLLLFSNEIFVGFVA